ncbi:MAG TPA: class I SAM-dependent methyltransferase [Chloroflexi bacterium]|jgi:ubiquinone/menaquinone biosynthesis C-methylase UbiE|nr:class I SAM-dependent methyltransferase [Chloroflexota bacterium]
MEMYDRIGAGYYDLHASHMKADIPFYVQEARQAGGPVLELGCGTGRILIPTAEAGVNITGIDLSDEMLDIARRRVAELEPDVQSRITLIQGDMRQFDIDRRFPLITIPFRAFMHLLTVDDQKQALHTIHRHLEPDGRLILNIFDPHLDLIVGHRGPLGSALKLRNEFTHPESGRRILIWDSRQYDLDRQILNELELYEELDEQGRVISRNYVSLTMRYLFRYEMQYLLELCGFTIEALYGDFDRDPFRHGGEQIWIARKVDS